ncbi:hypothetical protein [Neobacillus ginsengisoli]|uniref:Cytochrome c biogenesis protein ResB n=1 Tax=Neobacillus ginsengisoli TaxID=904295 RepID=A0ABT9XSY2_9BACI|nr:hypothetical protein [Neobacillus ginsengisoli]MDQ0198665.1 cytochrome c biogenesis protein ResB [Neobacillus ginsengisoli]
MTFAMAMVVVILLLALVGTYALTGKTDENYKSSTKQNTFRLTAIYIIVILFALCGLGWYISHI